MRKYTCTHCSYTYDPFSNEEDEPGIYFGDLDESWTCPHCDEPKESFIELPLNIQIASEWAALTDEEEIHVPYYTRSDGKIQIIIGSEDAPHPIEDGHFIEYIGLFDEDNEPIEISIRPQNSTVEFPDDDLDFFRVLASCNVHGVWEGKDLSLTNHR